MRNAKKFKNSSSYYNIVNDSQLILLKKPAKLRHCKRKINKKINFMHSIENCDTTEPEKNANVKIPSKETTDLKTYSSKDVSPLNNQPSSQSRVHTLFHYTPNQKIEKINFEKDKCPVCNYLKRQRIQSSDSAPDPMEHGLVGVKRERFRVKSASEGSDHQSMSECNQLPPNSSNNLSFTFSFSYPSNDEECSSGISVDLTNCNNISFRIEKISTTIAYHAEPRMPKYHPTNQPQNLSNNSYSDTENYCSDNQLLDKISNLSLNPYVSVLIPNSLKRCIFCNSNLTFCYECRKTDPEYFSNFNLSCDACKVCNYNEYSDFLSKSACIISEPIQSCRHNDVFDSLKTCLIPHRFLRYYKDFVPPDRDWHIIQEPSGGMPFTLMSYNVLCQKYCTAKQYPYCPGFALDWEYRKRGILEEIWKYDADIVCLQEMETSQFYGVFLEEMTLKGYKSVFVPKSRSRTMTMEYSLIVDGCATFWKIKRFEKVHHFMHEFMHSCGGVSKKSIPELINRVMVRDNVALSVILEVKDPSMARRRICVSNGHIHWDPELSDVKVVQTLLWTSELWHYIREFYKKENEVDRDPSEMPVILCGDFNSLPQSAVVNYLINGEVESTHEDFRDLWDNYLFEQWTYVHEEFLDNDSLKHRFNFDRAYMEENDNGIRWTNYTYHFRGMIDYIFYSKERLNILGHLKQIPESWFEDRRIVGVPHVHINSDHFSLLVKLELKPSTQSPPVGAGTGAAVSNTISTDTLQQRKHSALVTAQHR